MTKEQCHTFLQEHGVNPQNSWSLSELRFLVKELMQDNSEGSNHPLKGMHGWKIAELQEKCQELGLQTSVKATKAELRLVLRDYYENTSSGTTVMNFGRHKELTYEEVYQSYPDYVQWTKEEFQKNADNSSYHLRQFVRWVMKNEQKGMVGQQTPITPQLRSQNRPSSKVKEQVKEPPAASETEMDLQEMSKEELLNYVQNLKEDTRRHKEGKGTSSASGDTHSFSIVTH